MGTLLPNGGQLDSDPGRSKTDLAIEMTAIVRSLGRPRLPSDGAVDGALSS
jgi:hypothetical protein